MIQAATEAWIWQHAADGLKVIAIGGIVALLALAAYCRDLKAMPVRGWAFIVMRWLCIAAIVAVLFGPSRLTGDMATHARPILTVLLDTSGSMLTRDAQGSTRLRRAVGSWLSEDRLSALQAKFDVRIVGFAESLKALDAQDLSRADEELAAGSSSHYAASIGRLLSDMPDGPSPSSVLIVGDGHDSESSSLQHMAEPARNRNVLLHAVAVGSEAAAKDVAVEALPRQPYLMSGESGQIGVSLFQSGADDSEVLVRLRGQGVDQERKVRFEGQPWSRVEFTIEPQAVGHHKYEVTALPIQGEASTSNNSQDVFVEVVAERVRVLLLEGEPHWDTKFIAQALRSDPRVELTSITRVSEQKQQVVVTRSEDVNASVPEGEETWAAYDVVILGRGMEHMLSGRAIRALDSYVSNRAGALVFARGRPVNHDTPQGRMLAPLFASIEPAVWEPGIESQTDDWRLMPAAGGYSHPLLSFPGIPGGSDGVLAALPVPQPLLRVARLKPAASVLLTAGVEPVMRPVLVTMQYGSGRVIAVLGEGLWKWGMLPPRLSAYRGALAAFWAQAVRWSAAVGEYQPGQDVALSLSRTALRLGDPISFEVSHRTPDVRQSALRLSLTDPLGHAHELKLQPTEDALRRASGAFLPRTAGTWAVRLDTAGSNPSSITRQFGVYDVNVERLRSEARPRVLRELAESTGGYFFHVEDGVELATLLDRRHRAGTTPPSPRYAWDRLAILLLLLGWMGLEWIGRRLSGLP